MPRCCLYQACIACGSLALKKMPPIPVTRFMSTSCAKMSILTLSVSLISILLLTRLLRQDTAHDHYELAAALHATAAPVLITRLSARFGRRVGRWRCPQ